MAGTPNPETSFGYLDAVLITTEEEYIPPNELPLKGQTGSVGFRPSQMQETTILQSWLLLMANWWIRSATSCRS